MSKKTVLLVEDDSIYAGFVQSAVAESGLPYNLFHVSTVDSALAYVRGESQAHLEAVEHFAEHLKQFATSREHVTRLERDIAKLGSGGDGRFSQSFLRGSNPSR